MRILIAAGVCATALLRAKHPAHSLIGKFLRKTELQNICTPTQLTLSPSKDAEGFVNDAERHKQ